MEKLVTLNISGEFDNGFVVQAEVRQDAGTTKHQSGLAIAGASAKLPAHPELLEHYRYWQEVYNNTELFWPSRITLPNKDGFKTSSDQEEAKNKAFAACNQGAKLLAETLNNWLQAPDFKPIVDLLSTHLHDSTHTRILLATENHFLRRLPWCEWKLLENIPNAELVLASPQFKQIKNPEKFARKDKIKILVILGDNAGTDADEAVIQQLIPDAEICWLKEPQRRDLDAPLWEKKWDILFFAGHGKTENDGSIGKIQINSKDRLTIDEIKNHLKKTIDNGLKLAIFNACDGLGIAYQLAEGEDLHLPQIIVMREILPIALAPKFLQYFLEGYTQGLSLYMALRNSRKRLQIEEKDFPCASWLPVLYQNPAELPLNWSELFTNQLIIDPTLVEGIIATGAKDEFFLFNEPYSCDLPKIVVVGTSVVGKSSLVNELFGGRDVVRVSPVPQDDEQTVEENWAGLFKLIDSVSYDQFPEQVEQNIKGSDVVVHLWDINTVRRDDRQLYKLIINAGKPCITAINKCEQYTPEDRKIIIQNAQNAMSSLFIEISVTAQDNLSQLVLLIIKALPIELKNIAIEKIDKIEKIYRCRKVSKKIILETEKQAAIIPFLMNKRQLSTEPHKYLHELYVTMVEKIEEQYIQLRCLEINQTELPPLKNSILLDMVTKVLVNSKLKSTLWAKVIGSVAIEFYEGRINIPQIVDRTNSLADEIKF
jgi:GTP-binding protein EngB required for normal cell division